MRKLALILSVAAESLLAGPLLAHDGHDHSAHKMIGTITAVHVDMNHVEIKTTDGKGSDFYVTPKTKYLKGTAPATLSDLEVGTRVVVSAKQDGERMVAAEVKLGAETGAAKTPPAQSPPHH